MEGKCEEEKGIGIGVMEYFSQDECVRERSGGGRILL